jgi:hypothetical protein
MNTPTHRNLEVANAELILTQAREHLADCWTNWRTLSGQDRVDYEPVLGLAEESVVAAEEALSKAVHDSDDRDYDYPED